MKLTAFVLLIVVLATGAAAAHGTAPGEQPGPGKDAPQGSQEVPYDGREPESVNCEKENPQNQCKQG